MLYSSKTISIKFIAWLSTLFMSCSIRMQPSSAIRMFIGRPLRTVSSILWAVERRRQTDSRSTTSRVAHHWRWSWFYRLCGWLQMCGACYYNIYGDSWTGKRLIFIISSFLTLNIESHIEFGTSFDCVNQI